MIGGSILKTSSTLNKVKPLEDLGEGIFLDKNENPFSLPPASMEEIRDSLPQIMLNRYPDPEYRKLRECLSSVTGYSSNNIIVGNGGDELLWILFAAYVNPGDKVLTLEPTFSEYYHLSDVFKAEQRTVPLILDDNGFSIDEERFMDTISALCPSLVLIDSPNNPTGLSINSQFLDKISRLSPSVTVIDEAYGEFASDTYLGKSKGEDIPDGTVILKTLSKAWGLAGARLGYAICSEDVMEKINHVRSPYNVNVITQEVARIMLSYSEWMESRVSTIKYLRDKFISALNAIPGWRAFKSNSNYILIRTDLDSTIVSQSLEKLGIYIKDIKLPPSYVGNWFRVSVGKEEDMSLLLENFSKMTNLTNRNSISAAGDFPDIA